jgi:LPXTG-motif cell wall-anchored protein
VAGSYNVLHLATHATVDAEDPSQSFIAFYPQQRDSLANYRLYTHELYNMRLDSVKLVILSACEAGNGRLVRGEGVMSLARAFAYAGCPNIMTTLWKADDRSSAWLTQRLHHYLKQGWEKDVALQQAKLDYLNDPEVHPARKAPYYWANFVFIGDPAPLYDDRRHWWLIAVGLLLLAGGGALWWRLRRRTLSRQAA